MASNPKMASSNLGSTADAPSNLLKRAAGAAPRRGPEQDCMLARDHQRRRDALDLVTLGSRSSSNVRPISGLSRSPASASLPRTLRSAAYSIRQSPTSAAGHPALATCREFERRPAGPVPGTASSTPTAGGIERVGERPPSTSPAASARRATAPQRLARGGFGRSAASRKSPVRPRDWSHKTNVESSASPLKNEMARRRKQPSVQGGTLPPLGGTLPLLGGLVPCSEQSSSKSIRSCPVRGELYPLVRTTRAGAPLRARLARRGPAAA